MSAQAFYFEFSSDVQQILQENSIENELILENLIVQLHRKSLWFLGYYPHSWENRLLIRSLLNKCKTERHQTQPIAIDSTTTQFTALYWQSNSVNNHKIALDEFIQNLQQAMLTNTHHA